MIFDNKVKQSKALNNLHRQTAKTSTLSSENIGKHEFLKGKYILLGKELLEKAATIKRFEYPSLGSELKKYLNSRKTIPMIRES